MYVFPFLCNDINTLIDHHKNAMIIQHRFRKHIMSHANDQDWKFVRKNIIEYLGKDCFEILQNNSNIRKEWRSELNCWVYALKHEKSNILYIVHEVNTGLWDSPCTYFGLE